MAGPDSFHRWFSLILLVIGFAMCLYCLAGIVIWLLRKGRIGRLIVDASRPRSRLRVCSWIVYGFLWAALVVMEPARSLFSFNTALLIFFSTAILLDDALEFREGGIFSGWLIISWNRVKNWCWEDSGGGKQVQWSGKVEPGPAIMKVELVKPLLFRHVVRIRVPFVQVDAVEQAVAARVSLRSSSL